MKYLNKGKEPEAFTRWKEQAGPEWQPSYDDLRGEPKKAVVRALLEEQGELCCYCERRLMPGDFHIEHFRPQSAPGVDPLDFSNMLCSCQNQLKKGEPRHCGNFKGDWFDAQLLISPFAPDCENRFAFLGDGSIKPSSSDDLTAVATIARLGLDIPKLKALRVHAIEPFLDPELSDEDFQHFVASYLDRDPLGRLGEFWTTIRYLFSNAVCNGVNP